MDQTNTNPKFFYLRDKNRKPIGCVAYTINKHIIKFQLSVCHSKDEFQRTIGRNIACGRLNKSPIPLLLTEENSTYGIMRNIMHAIIYTAPPMRVKKCIQLWMNSK